jgi:glutamate synthase domain-containing protein 2
MAFIVRLRELSEGKPVGFKLCIGHPWEFLGICKAMLASDIYPDFIVIDGAEGGTGAAPLEFTDHVGMPLRDGLLFAHNALVGLNIRDRIRLGASGKVTTAFDIARLMAPIGATPRGASCSRSAACNRRAATPIAARPGSRPRTRPGSAPWSCPTRPSGFSTTTARP